MAKIVPLQRVPAAAVEDLLDRAFGADRLNRTAYRLRAGTQAIPELSFARIDAKGRLVGVLQSWPVKLAAPDGTESPLVMVGPVAVEPDVQQGGIGRALMATLLAAWKADGLPALMMIGDPEYYGRFFGFTADATQDWIIDGPVERHRLLARARPEEELPRLGRILPRPL